MRNRHRSLSGAAALLLTALACGETSSHESTAGAGGSGGEGAESGSAGTLVQGVGGSGGLAAGCPSEPPVYEYDCPLEQRGARCTYTLACQTGAQTVTLSCGQHGWELDNGAACLRGDFCPLGSNYQLQCAANGWAFGGGGETGLCATERVVNGTPCLRSALDATPPCGYYCPDGTWTVGSCGAGKLGEQSYEFSPPCAGEELASAGAAGAFGAAAGL